MIKKNGNGLLIVISSPSGGGKHTLISELLKRRDNIYLSVSDTSRKIRPGDVPGVDYNFISTEEFEKNIKNDKYLEYASVYKGTYYGTPKDVIDKKLKEGVDVLLEIDVEGAQSIRKLRKDALCIFIMPPSMKILKDRLVARKTDSKDKLIERFTKAYQEVNTYNKFNYVVVNDEIERAVSKIDAIITSEKCRVDRIEEFDVGNKEETIHELLMDFEK